MFFLMLDFEGPDYLGVWETMFIWHMQNTHLFWILKKRYSKSRKEIKHIKFKYYFW